MQHRDLYAKKQNEAGKAHPRDHDSAGCFVSSYLLYSEVLHIVDLDPIRFHKDKVLLAINVDFDRFCQYDNALPMGEFSLLKDEKTDIAVKLATSAFPCIARPVSPLLPMSCKQFLFGHTCHRKEYLVNMGR